MGWTIRAALALATGTLLAACGGGQDAATPRSSVAVSPTTTTSAPAPTPEELPVERDIRDAYEAALAAHPGTESLDRCTRQTPLTDTVCGTALSAAADVADATAQTLTAGNPEHAHLLYGAVLTTASAIRSTVGQLAGSMPCYGLNDKPSPPPQLAAEAQSICAEGADIAKSQWRIFLGAVGA
ncbi:MULTISPECIES: hypothetical protein [Prauserella]|uniref:Lipoprotein n=1 Tax=Prauserella endophytica TaxID=1592324 RepID=A0ABY2RYP6_9PSEU|nr:MULTISPECIES: hypothetical protein [Prauserella]TKG65811.1 hypothetical protein FCN18_26785 [Prauserella endophytica]